MGVLVNPLGWRLNSNRVWKINFVSFDDNNFGVLYNNLAVTNVVVQRLLQKLNEKLRLYGMLQFVGVRVYNDKKNITFLIQFRLNFSAFIRFRVRRRYKYYRKERRQEEERPGVNSRWIISTLELIKIIRKLIKRLEKQINFLEKHIEYIKNKIEKKKLDSIIYEKKIKLRKAKIRLENLKTKLFAPAYRTVRFWLWSRNFRVWNFLSLYKPSLAVIFNRPYAWWNTQFKKLYKFKRWKKKPVKFHNRILSLRFNKFIRSRVFIPHYVRNLYVRHRHVFLRTFWVKRRRKLKFKTNYLKDTHRIMWKSIFHSRRQPRSYYWKKMNRSSKRRVYLLLQEKKRKKDKSPLWELSSWRKMTWVKDRLVFRVTYRSLLLYFKVLPLLTYVKYFCETVSQICCCNLFGTQIFFLNMSKHSFVNASTILDFVEVFLKKRRRVTKINKLFYRIIKILRFFKSKYRLRGFKFLLAGRFLRRDRATFIWRTRGSVPLGTKLAKVDFAVKNMQMKYSRPIAKLWICRK